MRQKHAVLITCSGWSMVRHRHEQIKSLIALGWKVSAVAALSREQQAELRAIGAEPYDVSCEGTGKNLVKLLLYYHKIALLINRLRPDIVHNFSTKPIILATLAAKTANVRNVVCTFPGMGIIGTDRHAWTHNVIKWLFRYALRGRTITIFQNAKNMADLVEVGIVRQDRAVVIPGCGVDTDAISPKLEPPVKPRFVMVSRMMWSKGVKEFVQAAAIVRQSNPDVECLLVGPSDVDYVMQDSDYVGSKWLSGLNGDPARWIGRVQPREAEKIIRDSTALVLLSTAQEGIPRVLIEAAASGTPIITTDWPGCREVVDDGISGFLCRPQAAAEDAATAMLHLIEDEERAAEMRRHGPAIAKQFDHKTVMKHTLRVYRRVSECNRAY